MIFFDKELRRVAMQTVEEGIGFDEPLANAIRTAFTNGNLHLSLQSSHGMLTDVGGAVNAASSFQRKHDTYQALKPDETGAQRILVSISPKLWEVVSCFAVARMAFYSLIVLNEADGSEPVLRAGMIKLVQSVCTRWRSVLQNFIRPFLSPVQSGSYPGTRNDDERRIVECAAQFSESIDCVALTDKNGAVVCSHGDKTNVATAAAALLALHKRCIQGLGSVESVSVRSVLLSCKGKSALVGRVPGAPLTLALCAAGAHPQPGIALPFELALNAFSVILKEKGMLGDYQVEREFEPLRSRASWFGPARLVERGNYVGKKGGKAFHLCTCASMLKAVDGSLEWFEKRTDAIRAGLLPCKACNP